MTSQTTWGGPKVFIASIATADAAIVTVEFSGTINGFAGSQSFNPPLGTPFVGSYTFDSEATDRNSDPSSALYLFANSPSSPFIRYSVNIAVGGTFVFTDFFIAIADSLPGSGEDRIQIHAPLLNSDFVGTASLNLFFEDPTGTALSSDALVIPSLDAFSGALTVDCCKPFPFEFQAISTLQSITPVSEPSVLMLLVAALFAVGLMRYSFFTHSTSPVLHRRGGRELS